MIKWITGLLCDIDKLSMGVLWIRIINGIHFFFVG